MQKSYILALLTLVVLLISPVTAMPGVGVSVPSGGITVNGSATLTVNDTFTLPPGSDAAVVNVGTPLFALLDFYLPQGSTGAPGSSNATSIAVNNTVTLPPGSSATVVNVGTAIAALLDFGIPTGATGSPGAAGYTPIKGVDYFDGINGTNGTSATITINYTSTGLPGTNAQVTNIGTSLAAIFDFVIPAGATGAAGSPGINGTNGTNGTDGINGTAATVAANYTFTGSPGSNAIVTNVGTTSAALFDFTIPQGATGATGSPGTPGTPGVNGTNGTNGVDGTNGTAATIVVNYTFTGIAGSSAVVTNVGTSSAASFDFTIPQGLQGIPGINGTNGTNGTDGSIPDSSQFLFLNGTRIMTGNLNVNGNQIVSLITGTTGDTATNKTYVDDVNTSMKNYVDGGTYDNDAPYLFINGSRSMTGNLTMGSNYITGLITGSSGGSVPNKSYVDSLVGDVAPGATTQVMFNYNNVESANASFTFDNSSGIVTAPYFSGDGSGLTGIGSTAATALTFDVKACADGTIYKGQAVYISGASGSNPIVCQVDNTNTAKSRAVGLMIGDTNANSQGKVRRSGTLTSVDSRATNANLNPLGQTWSAGDLLFATTSGGLTNVRPTSGRSVKVAYSLEGSKNGDVLLAYPMENPVWITAASTEDVVLRMGDIASTNKVSFRNYVNTEMAYVNSYGATSFNGTNELANITMNNNYITGLMSGSSGGSVVNKSYVDAQDALSSNYNASYVTLTNTSYFLSSGARALTGNMDAGSQQILNLITGTLGTSATNKTYVDSKATHYGYVTLMAGSGMMTTTLPGTINQWETTTNKNNFIYWNFTDGGTETTQWIVDMPGDWDSTAAENGKVNFSSLWTAQSGSGTVKWQYSAKLFPDDAAIDTALALVGDSTDTLITTGDMHESPLSTGALITSVGTGGRTFILKVARDSATDTLSGTAQLIGVRIKYVRTEA